MPIITNINGQHDLRDCRMHGARIICVQGLEDKELNIDKSLIHLHFNWSGKTGYIQSVADELWQHLQYQITVKDEEKLVYQLTKYPNFYNLDDKIIVD